MNTPAIGKVFVADRDHHTWATRSTLAVATGVVLLLIVGVPSLDLHGPVHHVGVMDPLCGGTRAMFLLLTGHPATAATYNPIVFPLTAAAVLLLVRAIAAWATRRWLTIQLTRPGRRILLTLCIAALTALQIRQQLHSELLTQPWP